MSLLGDTVLDPTAPNSLTLFNLGTVSEVAAQYGNPVFYEGLAITGNSLLLSVGDPIDPIQKVWSLPLVRSNNHIVGFGSPAMYAPVPAFPGTCCFGNVLAGGLVVDGSALLYTTQSNSFLGQHTGGNPGSSATPIDLAGTGVSTGGLNYVPSNFTGNGAGQLKMSSTCEPGSPGCNAGGDWYTLHLNGAPGSYTLGSATPFTAGVTAFSFDYIPGDATFSAPGVILGDAILQRLDYYQTDSNGNPCNPAVNISCGAVVHLVISDVQIGLGVVRDPLTGDILFTGSDNEVWMLSDTAPEPSTFVLAGAAIALAILRRRRPRARA
jgi:hypothetical protein